MMPPIVLNALSFYKSDDAFTKVMPKAKALTMVMWCTLLSITVSPHFMLHAGIHKTYQKLVGESLVPVPACRYKAGDAGVSGDALCRRWERTSYLLCAWLKWMLAYRQLWMMRLYLKVQAHEWVLYRKRLPTSTSFSHRTAIRRRIIPR